MSLNDKISMWRGKFRTDPSARERGIAVANLAFIARKKAKQPNLTQPHWICSTQM